MADLSSQASPRRILFVLQAAAITGGAMTGIIALLQGLPPARYKAYLVVSRRPSSEEETFLRQYFEDIAAVKMAGPWAKNAHQSRWRQLKGNLSANLRTGFHLRSQIQFRQLIRRWQIDLVYTGTALVIEGALAARINSKPHIWHIKDSLGKKGNSQFHGSDRWVVGWINRLSNRIVVMSNTIARPFHKYGQTEKLQVIYDGVDLGAYRREHAGRAVRKRLDIAPDVPLVGLVASIGVAWKRHERFFEMAAQIVQQCPDARFVHFGTLPAPGTRAYTRYEALNRQIAALNLGDYFQWAGPTLDIPAMMDALTLLVHPCETEPFGRVAIEAMAAGVPVIGLDGGGIAESVVNDLTGVLVPVTEGSGALTDACLSILSDPVLYETTSRNAREHVARHFSLTQHVAQMTALFDDLLP
jgi:glycosyltransferase involved in cell wall biosynthesis